MVSLQLSAVNLAGTIEERDARAMRWGSRRIVQGDESRLIRINQSSVIFV